MTCVFSVVILSPLSPFRSKFETTSNPCMWRNKKKHNTDILRDFASSGVAVNQSSGGKPEIFAIGEILTLCFRNNLSGGWRRR